MNEAIVDLTGAKPKLEERTSWPPRSPCGLPRGQAAHRPALVARPGLALDGAARRRAHPKLPLDLLPEALRELVQAGEAAGPAIAELAALASYHLVGGRTQLLTRSEFGGRGSNTEPQQIMRQLAKTDVGLRQLCQIVLDGRAGRDPQELAKGTMPQDTRIADANILTPERLRELADLFEGKASRMPAPRTDSQWRSRSSRHASTTCTTRPSRSAT
ncbi:hypothetical protein [Streptomyces sp. C8S0]|uniref:hypothetical protein n=1 Tax=Streptomyces sp. C8S0 TaxID=2585716 RepID=UPI00125E3A8B|nr:hypothetical protein [Streptomyces sp. C8S0]